MSTAAEPELALDFPRADAPADGKLYFISLADGDVLLGEVIVRSGLIGMSFAPAELAAAKSCHHHSRMDAERWGGRGQKEALVSQETGERGVQLLLSDCSHIPQREPAMSRQMTVRVE